MDAVAKTYRAAAYCRLSREDGDRAESDSIVNQQRFIEDFCEACPNLELAASFADDGYTGTNFDRPGFHRMLAKIETGEVDCVIVKDLSRFGRDYIDMGVYLERIFPAKGVRFIAINDGVDSARGAYDLLLPLRNVFNAQYAKDISEKVRSALRTKQRRGKFCGAFAAYGYRKSPEDKNRLVADPLAAETVRRIFSLAALGLGRREIAERLNAEGIPSPAEYKRLMGSAYQGAGQAAFRGWTYAAVDRILGNELYLGMMIANRSSRAVMHGKARANARRDWLVAEGTHEPLISRALWDTVRAQSGGYARPGGVWTGFLRCGDCGGTMTRTTWNRQTRYCCGNYQRNGRAACTAHYISGAEIERIVREDINRVIAAAVRKAPDGRDGWAASVERPRETGLRQLEQALARVRALRAALYGDYRDRLLDKDEYLCYRADYAAREKALTVQLKRAGEPPKPLGEAGNAWAERLIRSGAIDVLDRAAVAQNVKEIRVFADRHIEIDYLFRPV